MMQIQYIYPTHSFQPILRNNSSRNISKGSVNVASKVSVIKANNAAEKRAPWFPTDIQQKFAFVKTQLYLCLSAQGKCELKKCSCKMTAVLTGGPIINECKKATISHFVCVGEE